MSFGLSLLFLTVSLFFHVISFRLFCFFHAVEFVEVVVPSFFGLPMRLFVLVVQLWLGFYCAAFFSIILHCMKRFSWLITTSASFVSQSSSWCCMFAFDCFFCVPFVVFNAVFFFFFSTACAIVSVAFRKKRCCRGRALCWCFFLLH